MKSPTPQAFASVLILIAFSGCAIPRVEVPSSAPLLGSTQESTRIPVRAIRVESSDKSYEIKSDLVLMSGIARTVMFPKQAREYLSQDLRDYLGTRFIVDERSKVSVELNLEQALSYMTTHHSGANWIPFVGVVTAIADGFQKVPVTFVVEVNAKVTAGSEKPEKVDVFVRQVEIVPGFSHTIENHQKVYTRNIQVVREELFTRLDAQLLSFWSSGAFVGKNENSGAGVTATIASEIAKLDSALADEKITETEHATLIAALKKRYDASTPPSAPAAAVASLVRVPEPVPAVITTKKLVQEVPIAPPVAVKTPAQESGPSANSPVALTAPEPKVVSKVITIPRPEKVEPRIEKTRGVGLGLKLALFSNELFVSSVALGSAANLAGIQVGDKILLFNREKPSVSLAQKVTRGEGTSAEIVFMKKGSTEKTVMNLNW